MGYWSIYVPKEEEKILKKRIEQIAEDKRWSFSQAVSEILREHLVEEKKKVLDETTWQMASTEAFFEGYSEQDSIYDTL